VGLTAGSRLGVRVEPRPTGESFMALLRLRNEADCLTSQLTKQKLRDQPTKSRGESWVARIYCAPTVEEAWVDFSKALAVCRSRLTMPFLN
jgi:hypothetical protein